MEESFSKTVISLISALIISTLLSIPTLAYSNGGYSADPSNREYGTELPDISNS